MQMSWCRFRNGCESMTNHRAVDVLIVGGGQAGSDVAFALRESNYPGSILIVGAEPHLPYQRPPLSKTFLSSEAAPDSLVLRGTGAYERGNIGVELGRAVANIDLGARCAQLDDEQTITFENVVLAQGGTPRQLTVPPDVQSRTHYLRSAADGERLRAELDAAQRVVVIGGGFIGLELAASARKRSKTVTVIEMTDRLLGRVVHPVISNAYADIHRRRGVDVILSANIASMTSAASGSVLITLGDGRELEADLIVVGIGLEPDTSLAAALGLEIERGVVCNEDGRTSHPIVFAAGDCSSVRDAHGRISRIESVHNATEQAKSVAATIAGAARRPRQTPWFWSDQYDVKLQIVGATGAEVEAEIDGDIDAESFVIRHCQNGELVGLTAVNRPRDFMAARRQLDAQKTLA